MPSSVKQQATIQITECPRDAIQSWLKPISTEQKIEYYTQLLQVGFNRLDFGSFVSPKAVPQMADTGAVAQALNVSKTQTKLLAIVANERGASDAARHPNISLLGFPLSISEIFQQKNTNASIAQALLSIDAIQSQCQESGKDLIVYLSMAFGNPYGETYNTNLVLNNAQILVDKGVQKIALADTVGLSTPTEVYELCSEFSKKFSQVETIVHLHVTPQNAVEKIIAALQAGCTHIDATIHGIGGCPFSGSELVGNVDTLLLVDYLNKNGYHTTVNTDELQKSAVMAQQLFYGT